MNQSIHWIRPQSPGDEDLLCYTGNAYLNLEKFAKAFFAYEQAIKLNQQHAESWYGRGLALKKINRTAEAEASFAKAKELGYED